MNNLQSQDFFGQISHPSTSDAKFLKVMPTGKMYLGLYGIGVFTSTDEGANWVSSMGGLSNLHVTELVTSGSDLYISTFGGGVFRSSNYGTDWVAVNNGLSDLRVNSIFAYPNGIIFAGTYGSGIYYSKDKGANWVASNKGLFWKDVTTFAMSKAGFVLAGTNGGGIYRSQDTGKTWIRSSSGLRNQYITKLKSNNANTSVYAGTVGRGVFQSANDGIAWSELDTTFYYIYSPDSIPLPDLNVASITFNSKNELVFSTKYAGIFYWDNDVMYAFKSSDFLGKPAAALDKASNGKLFGALTSKEIIYSTTNGEFWKNQDGPKSINWKNPKLFAAANNLMFVYDTSGVIYKSADTGKVWSQVKTATQRINQMCVDSVGNIFAAGNDGLWRSSNAGNTWQKVFMSNDTTVLQVQTAPNGNIWVTTRYYFLKDNPPPGSPEITDIKRVYYSLNNGINWVQAPNLVIYKEDPSPNVLGIHPNGDVYVSHGTRFWRSKNNGEIWNKTAEATTNEMTGIGFTKQGIIMVTCTEGVFRSVDYGNTFAKLPKTAIGANAVHITNDEEIYVNMSYNFIGSKEAWALMRSTDNGNNWQMLINSYNSENVQNISSSPDGDVYVSLESGSILRRVNPLTIETPQIVTLADSAKNVPLNPTFTWTAVGKADMYQIEVSEFEDFAYSWETMMHSATTHTIQRNLLYNTKYFFRVRGKNHASLGYWSPVRTFTTMLEPPTLKSPKDDSIGVTVSANLVWFKTNGASKYQIQVAKDSSFTSPVFSKDNHSDTTITTIQLEGLTNYYWRVKAKSDDSESYWSQIWSFKTVLGPPVLIAPADSAKDLDIKVTFKWHPAKAAKMYILQVTEFDDFVIKNEYNVSDTTFTTNQFDYNKTYKWRVRSTNDEGASDWSAIRTFFTGFEAPKLITPADKSVNIAITTGYTWGKVQSSNAYDIQVSKDDKFDQFIINENLGDVSTYAGVELENYQDYFWRMRAKTTTETGIWSAPNTFKTIVGIISLRIPANNSLNQPIEMNFTWFSTKGAIKYHLQVANDQKFEDLIFSQDTLSDITMGLDILQAGKTYFWRVRAKSNEGFGDWSEVWQFATGSNIAILKSPLNNSTLDKQSVTFEWSVVPNATSYHLIVSENADLSNPILDKNDIAQLFYTYESLAWNKKYYWKVKGNITGEETQWSQVWAFTVSEGGSVFDSKIISDLSVNPNPAQNYIKAEFILSENSNVTIKILDIRGLEVMSIPVGHLNSGKINYEINTGNLSSGTYFIQLLSSQGIEVKEFKIVE